MAKKGLHTKLISFVLSSALIVSGLSFSNSFDVNAAESKVYYDLASNIQDGTILHCFDWTYQQIIDELPDIKNAGFTSVQTSPAQYGGNYGTEWYNLYQPHNFKVSSGALGTENDLRRLCQEADKYGIKIIVDVVANHLAGDHNYIDYEYRPNEYWHHDVGGYIDYSNRYQVTHGDIGMKDINSEHYFIQQKVKNYIQQLKYDGVDGIRWDAAKHISLPSEYCNFWPTVIDKSMYNYGEILDTPVERNQDLSNSLIREYTNYMSVTDSTFSANIYDALRYGNVSGSIGYWTQVANASDNKMVYWGESHDTYANDGGATKYLNQNTIDRAYAIVASKNNSTALYFSRPFQTEKSQIKAGHKGSTHFESKEVAAVNHLHNLCVGEPDYYTTKDNVAVSTRKSGAVLVLGNGGDRYVTVPNGGSLTKPGKYIDEISGNEFTVTQYEISGKIGNSGIAVIYKFEGIESPTNPEAPSTEAPSTEAPSTEAPSTETPSTETPSTEVPSSENPVTDYISIYFSNNYNWNNVNIYYWGSSKSVNWPGKAMTYVSKNEYNETVYKANIPHDVKGIIFTNGNGAQTVDITSNIKDGQGYYISGNNGKYTVGSYKYN